MKWHTGGKSAATVIDALSSFRELGKMSPHNALLISDDVPN
jgi:hypothetical protein